MRNVLSAMLLVSLLAAPGEAVINIKLTVDDTDLAPGQITTVRIWAQGTASGVFSLGGNIAASGAAILTSNAGSFTWVTEFSSTGLLPPKTGEPELRGGWTGFGSAQTAFMTPDENYGKTDYVEVASYTVTAGNTSGVADLSFAGASVGGFRPLEAGSTNQATTMGTLTGVSIQVGSPSVPPLPGDIDLDGLVSILDVLQLVQAYGSVQGAADFDAACDLDGDATIGMGDLLILAGNFGKTN